MRERERERERDRQTDRDGDRQRDRQTDRGRETEMSVCCQHTKYGGALQCHVTLTQVRTPEHTLLIGNSANV